MEITVQKAERIEHQFNAHCKISMRNEARNLQTEEKLWAEKFISLDMLTSDTTQIAQLCVYDVDETKSICFYTHGYEIAVKNELLAEAIGNLAQKQRDAVLLSFFLEFKDFHVAKLMDMSNATFSYHKKKSFESLRKLMEVR